MKRSCIVLFAGLIVFFTSCSKDTVWGEGPVVTETRAVINFNGVSAAIPGKINFAVDPVFKVEVTAQGNILQVLRTRVKDGVLEIDFPNDVKVRKHEDITVNISGPTVDYLRLSGSGNMNVTGNLITNLLGMHVSGSGNIAVQQAAIEDKINADISGSGNISIASGSAKNEELHISGSGNINISNVIAERAEIHISGSGDMKVNLSQFLDAHISGSGSVLYLGNPVISTHVSGSGSVKPL